MLVSGLGQCSLDYLALVDAYPDIDTKKEVLAWHEQGGGPVATALVALSRLGIPCRFCGVIGDDEAGEKIRQALIEEGVDVKDLRQRKRSISQTAFIAVEKSTAKRTIFWRRPSGSPLQQHEVAEYFLAGSDFLLIDGLMMEASLSVAKRAKELNIPVMLDGGSARPGMIELAGLCDYVVASAGFASGLGWDFSADALLEVKRSLGVKVLTITFGAEGSVSAGDDRIIISPAFTVDAVDTTGAGDVFHGGYIYGLLKGWELERVLRFASAFAAMKCRQMGGRTGIPRLSEVMQFLKERSGC